MRADFDRLSRMLATKVRALGEVLAARNQQNTDHICPGCEITTDSWLQWKLDVLQELSKQSKLPMKYIDDNIKWRRRGPDGPARIKFGNIDDDSDNDTVVFQPMYGHDSGS